jgi:hypothetical protein
MDIETAKEIIAGLKTNHKIQAITTLRRNSGLGLLEAKLYLEQTTDYDALLKTICHDYVQDKADLLVLAKHDLKRAQMYVDQLEAEIAMEKEADL